MAQRDEYGRFQPGNSAGKGHGRPHASRVVALRTQLLEAVTPDRFRKIVESMLEAAEAGDHKTGQWLIDRCMGPAQPLDLLQRFGRHRSGTPRDTTNEGQNAMSFSARTNKAWKTLNPSVCPACKNSGGQKVIVWDGTPEPPEPKPCPKCGRYARCVKTIILAPAAGDARC